MRYWGHRGRCFRYHKGTDFQANHNVSGQFVNTSNVVLDTTKVQIFKQITTSLLPQMLQPLVVLDTTKVQIFKQITTDCWYTYDTDLLF